MTTSPTITSPVETAFAQHERAIRVPDSQNDEAKLLHPTVRGQIADALGLAADATFLAGSYRRKTQIAPLGDLDIVVVIDGPTSLQPQEPPENVLNEVAAAATSCDAVRRIKKIGIRAVTCVIEGSAIEVDLVPAIEQEAGGRLWLCRNKPQDGFRDWTLENPRGQIDAAIDANGISDGLYIRLVRVAKSWNVRMGTTEEKLLPSYAIEAAVHAATKDGVEGYADGLAATFEILRTRLAEYRSLPDPGEPSRDVLEMLAADRRQRAIPVARNAEQQARYALTMPPEAALRVWGDLLGPSFPSPGHGTGALAAGLTAGTVGATGAGISIASPARALTVNPRAWRCA